jgi:hypothetical protein
MMEQPKSSEQLIEDALKAVLKRDITMFKARLILTLLYDNAYEAGYDDRREDEMMEQGR